MSEKLYVRGFDFNEEIAKELLNLDEWNIEYEVHPNQIIIKGASEKNE
jgi:hypothetical protein